MQLEGTIKSVTFHSADSGFSVFRVTVEGEKAPVVVTGTFPDLGSGEKLLMEGEWGRHPKYGRQFKCTSYKVAAPQESDIGAYLASGIFRGIGPKTAEAIVKVFGDDTADILDNHPDIFRKAKIKGLTGKKVEAFLAAWQTNRHSRETMLFLYGHGIAGSVAKRLWNQFGAETIARITENPYLLCEEIWGIGFLKADEIAMKVGIPKESPKRLQSALMYVLQESSFSEGHVYLPKDILLEKTFRILRIPMEDDDAVYGLIQQFDYLCERERIKRVDDDCFYPPMFRAEQSIADNILYRLAGNALPTAGFERALMDWEHQHKFAFDPIQRQAIQMALAYRISIITGGPGTGKTTILKGILHLAQKTDETVFLAAPTGRAARRMQEVTGHNAKTLHRLLEINPETRRFTRDENFPIETGIMIVDEFSMVDTWLCAGLMKALPERTHLVLIGDKDQLPSIGPGNVLRDLLSIPEIPCIRLERIFRQAGGNDIAEKATLINQGRKPSPVEGNNFHYIPFEDPDEALHILSELVTERIPQTLKGPVKDLQVLVPMHKGPLGTIELNDFLQKLLNDSTKEFKSQGINWKFGDRVMQLRNNYEKNVFNGDVGKIIALVKNDQKITVDYEGHLVGYERDELDEI
jgi:exodeoxyribonuclease V alpha subunit